MFENQPNRPAGTAPVQPRPITPPPIRPFSPAREPEDIFAGVENAGPKMPGPTGMPPAPRKRGGRRIVLVFIVFFIIILLVAGGVLAYVSFLRQAPVTTTNTPAVNLNLPVNTNANLNANANANVNVNINQPPVTEIIYTPGADTDLDGLTDAEEDVYGTNKDNPDTDGDNYIDGVELIGLFDPTKGGGALLKDSVLVKIFKNETYGYTIYYPAKWQAIPLEEGTDLERQITFSPLPVNIENENIKVNIEDNAAKLALYDWLLAKIPNVDLTAYVKLTTKSGFEALLSPDNLKYYLTKENQLDKIYVISYTPNKENITNYLSTLQMMVNSFTLVK